MAKLYIFGEGVEDSWQTKSCSHRCFAQSFAQYFARARQKGSECMTSTICSLQLFATVGSVLIQSFGFM